MKIPPTVVVAVMLTIAPAAAYPQGGRSLRSSSYGSVRDEGTTTGSSELSTKDNKILLDEVQPSQRMLQDASPKETLQMLDDIKEELEKEAKEKVFPQLKELLKKVQDLAKGRGKPDTKDMQALKQWIDGNRSEMKSLRQQAEDVATGLLESVEAREKVATEKIDALLESGQKIKTFHLKRLENKTKKIQRLSEGFAKLINETLEDFDLEIKTFETRVADIAPADVIPEDKTPTDIIPGTVSKIDVSPGIAATVDVSKGGVSTKPDVASKPDQTANDQVIERLRTVKMEMEQRSAKDLKALQAEKEEAEKYLRDLPPVEDKAVAKEYMDIALGELAELEKKTAKEADDLVASVEAQMDGVKKSLGNNSDEAVIAKLREITEVAQTTKKEADSVVERISNVRETIAHLEKEMMDEDTSGTDAMTIINEGVDILIRDVEDDENEDDTKEENQGTKPLSSEEPILLGPPDRLPVGDESVGDTKEENQGKKPLSSEKPTLLGRPDRIPVDEDCEAKEIDISDYEFEWADDGVTNYVKVWPNGMADDAAVAVGSGI